MKPLFPNLSFSTVYRNLGILERQSQLLRLPCPNFDRYDGNTAVHTHFYCRTCERVYDVETGGVEDEVLKSFRDGAHTPEGCNIMFYGVCEKCNSTNFKEDLS
jgi:Fur family peroxide stress response transcriptional regulator